MSASHAMPWSELLQELIRMCNERRTGTLFIATNDNRLARIALKDGAIAAVEFQRKQGIAAIQLMKSILAGTWRFNDELMLVSGVQSLPATSGVLRMLADKSGADTVFTAHELNSPVGPAPIPTASGATAPPTKQRFSFVDVSELLQIKELITTELIAIIGPMGKLVSEDYLSELTDRRSVMMAIEKIATEIDDPDLERQFKLSVAEKLQEIQKGRKT